MNQPLVGSRLTAVNTIVNSMLVVRAQEFGAKLKASGIKANCGTTPGGCSIQVSSPSYAQPFDDDLDRAIKTIAIKLGFTGVRGTEINVDVKSDPHSLFFYPA